MFRLVSLFAPVCAVAVAASACVPVSAPAEVPAPVEVATPEHSEAAPAQADAPIPRIFFVDLADGATVTSPMDIQLGAEDLFVEGEDSLLGGGTHLHIIIDAPCL